ncbi:anti-phage deoxyguanosine triphosphatase [Bowmanella dokdonensis]|uniref:Deoxyguanosinetriphosphate triphosphohydrolase-like protein n=1 Tax=Bowmanella dokdonensis TaxID=751969 RepID=A0A939DKV7_9ALTE|nr:anti-phage deoxyguanosine triphosphatase [Bowmanella dokdonensis]MBN7824512.1 deoxyguanosinetriphosphate triphosphohydrolase family protein [Bowmanella dokdonensis]
MAESPWLQRRQPQPERQGDHRSAFQRDKARILHSAAFRRLQAKTQVLGVGMNDFHRTRLTHSLEASQIGQGIAAQLRQKYPDLTEKLHLSDHLIEALCLGHDIGHPPFGHGGEVALNYMMREEGGFEGNGQTFRIVTKLEPYTPDDGMNLCRRTLLGLVKYPNLLSNLTLASPRSNNLRDWIPAKGLFDDDAGLLDWLLAPLQKTDRDLFMSFQPYDDHVAKTRYKSFDASIMELADDIAYSIHDLEDAIVTGIVSKEAFVEEVTLPIQRLDITWLSKQIQPLSDKLFQGEHYARKDAIGALVNGFITAIEIRTTAVAFKEPLLARNAALPDDYQAALDEFKGFVFRRVIQKSEVQMLEYKGQQLVVALFEAFSSDPQKLLPENTRLRWLAAEKQGKGMRVISDYISGMTDEFASRLYSQLFLPRTGSGLTYNSPY